MDIGCLHAQAKISIVTGQASMQQTNEMMYEVLEKMHEEKVVRL
jgi:hypothetical protein